MSKCYMTPSDLKFLHERVEPESYFFTRKTMSFFGDTMRNFGVCNVRLRHKYGPETGQEFDGYELYRRRPVKHGLQSSHYFDKSGRLVQGVEPVN